MPVARFQAGFVSRLMRPLAEVLKTGAALGSFDARKPAMNEIQLSVAATQWINDILVWIGFGTVIGLLAKAIMPGRDPGGAIATLAMGIGGVVIGCGTLTYFYAGERVTPMSPIGFLVATGGAFLLLIFYRLLGGYWFIEGELPRQSNRLRRTRRRRRRRLESAYYDD